MAHKLIKVGHSSDFHWLVLHRKPLTHQGLCKRGTVTSESFMWSDINSPSSSSSSSWQESRGRITELVRSVLLKRERERDTLETLSGKWKEREMWRGLRWCTVQISHFLCDTFKEEEGWNCASVVKHKMSACFWHTNHISCIVRVRRV